MISQTSKVFLTKSYVLNHRIYPLSDHKVECNARLEGFLVIINLFKLSSICLLQEEPEKMVPLHYSQRD